MKRGKLFHYTLIFIFICGISMSSFSQIDTASQELDLFELSLEDLLNIEITTAGKTEQKVSEIPASVVILSKNEIEVYGFQTISEILEHISGLYNIDNYQLPQGNFGVRGFWSESSNKTIFLLNNMPLEYEDVVIPVQSIDRIEIIRGPMSVIYGSGAMFGAINIITNLSPESETEGLVSTSYGSKNTRDVYGGLKGKSGDFSYSLNAGLRYSDGKDVQYKDMITDEKFIEFQTIEALYYGKTISEDLSTKNKLNSSVQYLNFHGSFKKLYFSILSRDNEYGSFSIYPSLKDGYKTKSSNNILTIGYKNKFSDLVSVDYRLNYANSTQQIDYDMLTDNFYGYSNFEVNTIDSELDVVLTPSDKLNIVSGINAAGYLDLKYNLDIPSLGDPSLVNTNLGLTKPIIVGSVFSQWIYRPTDKISLIGGLRVKQTQDYEAFYYKNEGSMDPTNPTVMDTINYQEEKALVLPRIAAVVKLNDHNLLKGMIGTASNRQSEEFKPEKVTTYEINYTYTQPQINASANIFYNTFDDLIINEFHFDNDAQIYISTSANAGSLKTIGTEITVSSKPAKNLFVELGLTYQNTTDLNNEEVTVAYCPDLLGQLKTSYKWNIFTLGLTAYYVDEMESHLNPEDPNTGAPAARIGDQIKAYSILGMNIRANDIYKGLFASVRISNLLDHEIRYPTTQNTAMLTTGTIGSGRSVQGTIGWKF